MTPRADTPPTAGGDSAVLARRRFLTWIAGAAAAFLTPAIAAADLRRGFVVSGRVTHPEPRPGIDGSRVLTAEQLQGAPHLIDLFDAVREIPHIADGIRCYCGCADLDGYRSLLSCYEGVGMAQHCEICQGQARLAHGRWQEGQSLDQIRRAIDARYSHGGGQHAAMAAARAHCRA